MSPPDWLVTDIMPEGGLAVLYGPPKTGKSFAAIDWSMCIATGRAYHGLPVSKGFVVYVSAEGGKGIGKRAKAWLQHHTVPASDVDMAWLTNSIYVNLESGHLDSLVERIFAMERQPKLVVLDTLARTLEGDENTQLDMGRFIQGVDMLRMGLDSAVLVVHHTRLAGDRERGNTALRGAADTMISLEAHGTAEVLITCSAQKDDEGFDPLHQRLERVTMAYGGHVVTSCVLVDAGESGVSKDAIEELVYELLKLEGPLRFSELEARTGVGKDGFAKAFQALRYHGRIVKTAGSDTWETA